MRFDDSAPRRVEDRAQLAAMLASVGPPRVRCAGCTRFGSRGHKARHIEPEPLCSYCADRILRRGYRLLRPLKLGEEATA